MSEASARPAGADGTTPLPGRVALVLGSSTGGIGRHVLALASALVAAGTEVTVCGPADTEDRFGFTGHGVAFRPVEIPAAPTPRDIVAILALRRALAEARPAVVHAHGLRAGLVSGWSRPVGVPLVVTWHNSVLAAGVKARILRALEQRVARTADVTLGASADLVERARELGGRDVRLGPVAAPELPPPARERDRVREDLGVAQGQPLVLSVGRLHPQKGYDVLVSAASRWRARTPPPVVVIAGSGPSYPPLATQISAMRAPVTLLGHRNDVPDLLGAADLAVVSSVWEARQLFAQEAMRAGVPLVGTAVGGLPGLVGDAAVLVPPRDVDALDAAVTALLDDPGRRAALARAGREHAATWPTPEQTVAQIRGVYAELIARAVQP